MESLRPEALAERRAEIATLDVRDELAFAAGHLKGSGHIPASELKERRSELPPRGAPLLVVAEDGARAAAAAAHIAALGYEPVSWLDASPTAVEPGLMDRAPAVRLWRPSPFLDAVLPRLDRARKSRVLDLAAGAGREAVFMALNGFEVEAWDNDRGVLESAARLAARNGVSLTTMVRDLERRDPELPVGQHDVVMVFRFLHRPLFPQIARAVAPGGWVVYETFLRGQERFGRPSHPRFLLDSGELPRHFPGFAVESYQERTPEGGPFMAALLARQAP